jgi:cellulose synthase/poly-beta-1,6-N-acetylglucosamine synthase-like glycosyltransferase
MVWFALGLFFALVASVILQTVFAFVYLRLLKPPPLEWPSDQSHPKASVILCLRGSDPYLEDTLRALLAQDYESYDAHLIIDSRQDPAWATVERILKDVENPACRVFVNELIDKPETCSLKNASLLQAVTQLEDDCKIVAILDSDTLPHTQWLRQLIAPFQDPSVGVATGNRWFAPREYKVGTILRYLWNAAAISQMYFYKIVWGGTCAFRRETFDDCHLAELWKTSLSDDVTLSNAIRKSHWKYAFVPELIMVNRESIRLGPCLGWIQRQLLVARLYHTHRFIILMYGLLSFLLFLSPIVLFFIGLGTGDHKIVALTLSGFLLHQANLLWLLYLAQQAIQRIAARRGVPFPGPAPGEVLKIPWGLLLTQVLYPVVLFETHFIKEMEWRGIRYRIQSPFRIQRLSYRTFEESEDNNGDESESL